jgi:uncharacterized membrane protein YfcA
MIQALHAIQPLYCLSGFAVGVLVGMTGMGGGSLMTPALVLLFGIHPTTAVGTDLFYASATKTGGTLFHGLARTVNWPIVLRLACGSVPATIATLLVLLHIGIDSPAMQHVITIVLAGALFASALALIFRSQILAIYNKRAGTPDPRRAHLMTIAVGAILGVLVSISSVGAGALGVTALLLLYPRLPLVTIVGSDIAHAVPLTLLAGLGHAMLGSVDWGLLTSLLLGSIPGILLGSFACGKIPEPWLRLILAATLVLIATRLVI